MTIALNILKLIGLVLTGAFGILGLLTEFRDDKTKKVTKWGKVALSGIILSTALSLVAQILESAKSVRDAREAEKQARDQISRSNEILNNLNRSLNPLTNVRITYWLKVPLDAPELAAYRKRLTDKMTSFLARSRSEMHVANVIQSDTNGRPKKVSIPSDSPLMPCKGEVIPYNLLRLSGLHLSILKNRKSDHDFVRADDLQRPRADLSLYVGSGTGPQGGEHFSYSLQYDLQTKELTIYAFNLFTDPQFWSSNNQIQAVPDLSNTQLAVQIGDPRLLNPSATGEPDEQGKLLSRLRDQMELESLMLKINTRELWVKWGKIRDMRRVSGGNKPITVYLTEFPKNVDSLQLR